jgi:heat-inducible transcriptional repressor
MLSGWKCGWLLRAAREGPASAVWSQMVAVELNRRERFVLETIAGIFLRTGRAVASHQVAGRPAQRHSPASIRSVMARLEERGLLSRSHPSAGCVPTDQGLRVFLDLDLPRRRPSAHLRRRVEASFKEVRREIVDDFQWVAGLAANLTNEAGVVVRPMGDDPVLESITLVPLGGNRVLGVLVTADGWIGKQVISVTENRRDDEFSRLAERTTARFRGMTFRCIRDQIEHDSDENPRGAGWERDALLGVFPRDEGGEVLVKGAENLIDHEAFSEVDRIRSVLKVLDDRPQIACEWRRALATGSTGVVIGSESRLTANGNLGMVATLFYKGDCAAGAVGIVGPRRMDYGRIVSIVRCIGETLSEYLDDRGYTDLPDKVS